jgi:glycosyltransferase involved in cell wall biosynthesis
VGLDAAGGSEQVLSLLDRALAARGHCSIVIACAGSRVADVLMPVRRAEGPLTEAQICVAHARHRAAIAHALVRWQVDLVHMHGCDFYDYLPPPGVPVLATLHLPPSWYPQKVFASHRPATFLNCVSSSQGAACPPAAYLLPAIPNGIDLDAFPDAAARRRNFALVVGRICPEKGVHLAIRAARQAGVPIAIAGPVFAYPAHRRYFAERIAPELGRDCRLVGPVGLARKRRLMRAARCVLLPSLVPETSSLVAREAAACGTPVIAFRAGALVEAVDDGRTGFLVDDADAMADAIGRAGEIDPAACRAHARAHFDGRRMAERYLALYARLAGAPERLPGAA